MWEEQERSFSVLVKVQDVVTRHFPSLIAVRVSAYRKSVFIATTKQGRFVDPVRIEEAPVV